jgi:hypothetical protein
LNLEPCTLALLECQNLIRCTSIKRISLGPQDGGLEAPGLHHEYPSGQEYPVRAEWGTPDHLSSMQMTDGRHELEG